MKFGTFVPQGWRMEMGHIDDPAEQWQALTSSAQGLEGLGFDSLWLYDHFHTVPKPRIAPTFECWTTMAALAQITKTARLGQLVTCSLYRNPAYLAKVASCVDVMSAGRVDVGLGAGWKREEFEAYNYKFPGIRGRLDRMAETAKVLRAMFTEERATFKGEHYAVRNAINEPKPVQTPHPPIWIGTQGEKVGLRMVAELADGWNHNRGPEVFEQKLTALRGHCERIDRDPDDVMISVERSCVIYDSEAELRAYVERYWPNSDPDRVAAYLKEDAVVGTAEQVADQFRYYTERGAELVIVWFQDLADVDRKGRGGPEITMAERFINDVVPLLV